MYIDNIKFSYIYQSIIYYHCKPFKFEELEDLVYNIEESQIKKNGKEQKIKFDQNIAHHIF